MRYPVELFQKARKKRDQLTNIIIPVQSATQPISREFSQPKIPKMNALN